MSTGKYCSVNNYSTKEKIEMSVQKNKLKQDINNSILDSYILFDSYLRHAYATGSLTEKNLNVLHSINQEFEGKAKMALTERFSDNYKELNRTNKNMETFIKSFHT